MLQPMLNLEKRNGSRISPNVAEPQLCPVILINSCSVNKQTQPKRRMLKAKFIQIEYYEYLKTNLIKIYKPLHTALYSWETELSHAMSREDETPKS